MENREKLVYQYWGKTARGEAHQGDDYHLLCWHSLDVAACGYNLVMHNVFNAADHFAKLGVTDRTVAAQFFAWLLLWHDIGKFSRLFQQQFSHPNLPNATRNVGISGHHHTLVGKWLWNSKLCKVIASRVNSSLPEKRITRLIDSWMVISVGHHGFPVGSDTCANDFLESDILAAQVYADEIHQHFPEVTLPENWLDDEWQAIFQPVSWLISGLVVMADWIGSNNHFFPMVAKAMPFPDYWATALTQAEQAIKSIPAHSPVAPFSGIQTLFPFVRKPTPLQQLALDIDISAPGPQLFILEDVTGAGKTEAALTLAHRLMAQGKGQGIYIGLPTMATANAMYERMYKSWSKLYEDSARPSLILAHSARQLSDTFSRSVWTLDPEGTNDSGDEVSGSQGCAAWFMDSRKKALLAEIGVGTLDQALMAVLPFKHQNLRLLGLGNKVLLADEVHAYDPYTSRLLEALIEAQTACGNCTILLTATLSQKQRNLFTGAFNRALTTSHQLPVLGLNDYPWVTHLNSGNIANYPVATRNEVQRCVSVGWMEDEEACLAAIQKAVEQGQCVAWIRNSVDDAIKSYRALRDAVPIPEEDILLFHSRFAFHDRHKIESKTLSWFGKENNQQRAGKVLIATQVVEQSLDLDFDVLISDLAPVDLLIQRAGRLHRHVRDINGNVKKEGKDERPAPCLQILAPAWDDNPKRDWISDAMRNTSFVYSNHARLWLTQRILRQQGEIRMPESARLLIEAVYGSDLTIPKGLAASLEKAEGDYYGSRSLASLYMITLLNSYGSDGASEAWNEQQSTRLGEKTEDIWLAYNRNGEIVPYAEGKHGWEMSCLRVRQYWWEKRSHNFCLLKGEALEEWCNKMCKKQTVVIILPEDTTQGGYSAKEGLMG